MKKQSSYTKTNNKNNLSNNKGNNSTSNLIKHITKKQLIIGLISFASVATIVTASSLGVVYGTSTKQTLESSVFNIKSPSEQDHQKLANDATFDDQYIMNWLSIDDSYIKANGLPTITKDVNLDAGTIKINVKFNTEIYYNNKYTKQVNLQFDGFRKPIVIVSENHPVTTKKETVTKAVKPLLKQTMNHSEALASLNNYTDYLLQDFQHSFYLDALSWTDSTLHGGVTRSNYHYIINHLAIDLKQDLMFFDIDFGCNYETYHKLTSKENGTPIALGYKQERHGIYLSNNTYYDQYHNADSGWNSKFLGADLALVNSCYYQNVTFK